MLEPICQRRRRVVNRHRDGCVEEVCQCAHGAAQSYRNIVSSEQCGGCVLRQPLAKIGLTCRENPPSDPTWLEPRCGIDGDIIYSFQEGVKAPPAPEGYAQKARGEKDDWLFKSEWSDCSHRQMMNKRTPNGDLHVEACCGLHGNAPTTWEQCKDCLSDVGGVGGILNEKTALKTLALPEHLKKLDENGVPSLPFAAQLMATYWRAVKRWIAAGRPRRTKEEVKSLHVTFCAKCDWYDPGSQRCKGCGCRVAPKGIAILNKIEMATEHCPQKFW